MSEIEQHLCATCGNDHCSYGGYGPMVADGDDRKRLCEHWEPVADLKAENAELRELVRDLWHDARLLDANSHIDGMRLGDSKVKDYMRRMRELGVEV